MQSKGSPRHTKPIPPAHTTAEVPYFHVRAQNPIVPTGRIHNPPLLHSPRPSPAAQTPVRSSPSFARVASPPVSANQQATVRPAEPSDRVRLVASQLPRRYRWTRHLSTRCREVSSRLTAGGFPQSGTCCAVYHNMYHSMYHTPASHSIPHAFPNRVYRQSRIDIRSAVPGATVRYYRSASIHPPHTAPVPIHVLYINKRPVSDQNQDKTKRPHAHPFHALHTPARAVFGPASCEWITFLVSMCVCTSPSTERTADGDLRVRIVCTGMVSHGGERPMGA